MDEELLLGWVFDGFNQSFPFRLLEIAFNNWTETRNQVQGGTPGSCTLSQSVKSASVALGWSSLLLGPQVET